MLYIRVFVYNFPSSTSQVGSLRLEIPILESRKKLFRIILLLYLFQPQPVLRWESPKHILVLTSIILVDEWMPESSLFCERYRAIDDPVAHFVYSFVVVCVFPRECGAYHCGC